MNVVVLMATYNHEKTVAKAIQSVLSQVDREGNPYPLLLMAHDDGSQDNTGLIVKQYRDVNTGRMLRYLWSRGGLMANYNRMFFYAKQVEPKYIAFCDGDDYWIDPYKLQKQVEYMDEHGECGLCITKVHVQNEGSDELIPMDVDAEFINRVISFDTLLMGNAYINAQSYLLRWRYFINYVNFEEFRSKGFKLWDLPIVLKLIRHTDIHCLDFYSAVFYKQKESTTNTRSRLKRLKYILAVNKIKFYFVRKYGCQSKTKFYLITKFLRDLLSIILGRWYEHKTRIRVNQTTLVS